MTICNARADISKTLEVLEAMGVPVCGFQTATFPAFFTNDSGCRAPMSELAVARMMACQDDLALGEEGREGERRALLCDSTTLLRVRTCFPFLTLLLCLYCSQVRV